MEVSSLLSAKPSSNLTQPPPSQSRPGAFHHHSPHQTHSTGRLTVDTASAQKTSEMTSTSPIDMFPGSAAGSANGTISPQQRVTPKHVQFELLFSETPQYRARLPLRVQIYPHDSTESIVTTVKNFYGLYPHPTSGGKGVSFEDDQSNTLIARYENFSNNMVVYVRVIEESPPPPAQFGPSPFPHTPMDALYHAAEYGPQAAQHLEQHIARSASRTSIKRSPSPGGTRGRRSESVGTNPTMGKKAHSRSSRTRGPNHENHSDSVNGYDSGDGAPGSSSSKIKEQIGNTDISVENIVEGGRRKRAKFESSVSLPTFPIAHHTRRLTFCQGTPSLCAPSDAHHHIQFLHVPC